MSDKYIIRNCPMYFHTNCYGHTGNCDCQDCTDCLLKQIVDYCKSENEFYNNKVHKKDVELGRAIVASNVLQLLDIKECGDESN